MSQVEATVVDELKCQICGERILRKLETNGWGVTVINAISLETTTTTECPKYFHVDCLESRKLFEKCRDLVPQLVKNRYGTSSGRFFYFQIQTKVRKGDSVILTPLQTKQCSLCLREVAEDCDGPVVQIRFEPQRDDSILIDFYHSEECLYDQIYEPDGFGNVEPLGDRWLSIDGFDRFFEKGIENLVLFENKTEWMRALECMRDLECEKVKVSGEKKIKTVCLICSKPFTEKKRNAEKIVLDDALVINVHADGKHCEVCVPEPDDYLIVGHCYHRTCLTKELWPPELEKIEGKDDEQ